MKDKPSERQLSLSFDEASIEKPPAVQLGESAQVFCLASHRAVVNAQSSAEEAKQTQLLLQKAIESVRYF